MSLSFPNLHFVVVSQQKNVCIIKHCFGLMYCNDTLWDVVDLLLRFFVQDQRGREDFRKALFISLSNRIYIPLWVVLVCSNMTSVPKRLGSKYTLGKNTSNKQFFVSVFFMISYLLPWCQKLPSFTPLIRSHVLELSQTWISKLTVLDQG